MLKRAADTLQFSATSRETLGVKCPSLNSLESRDLSFNFSAPVHIGFMKAPVLDMLPFGVVLLNSRAKILSANAYARRLLSAGGDLKEEGGVLRTRSNTHNRALTAALQRLSGPCAGMPTAFSIARANRRPISIVITRLPTRGSARNSRMALFVSDSEPVHCASASLLRDLFDFTAAESSIASRMMGGMDTASIAHELEITRNTLRDHLKSMFGKTQTRNQGELLYTLLRCPASLVFNYAADVADKFAKPVKGEGPRPEKDAVGYIEAT